jgi:hypothetical protein
MFNASTPQMFSFTAPQGDNFSAARAVITFDSVEGTKDDGILAILRFRVSENAPADGIALTLTVGSIGDDSMNVADIPASEYDVVSGKIKFEQQEPDERGRVLGRNTVTVADASLAFRGLLGLAPLTGEQYNAAKLGDDTLTIGHVLRIFRFALGLSGTLG